MTTEFKGEPFAVEALVTDTRAYDVVRHTEHTVTLRPRSQGEEVARNHAGSYPTITYATVSNPSNPEVTRRIRKDGTVRLGPGARPVVFVTGEPVVRTNYSY